MPRPVYIIYRTVRHVSHDKTGDDVLCSKANVYPFYCIYPHSYSFLRIYPLHGFRKIQYNSTGHGSSMAPRRFSIGFCFELFNDPSTTLCTPGSRYSLVKTIYKVVSSTKDGLLLYRNCEDSFGAGCPLVRQWSRGDDLRTQFHGRIGFHPEKLRN